MPNRQLYDRIERLTKQTLLQLHELEQISEELQKVIEENHNLTMENLHLKERLDTIDESVPADQCNEQVEQKKKRSQSLINLENIYDQGFHICNLYYGKRRENDESCMFCTEILYSEN